MIMKIAQIGPLFWLIISISANVGAGIFLKRLATINDDATTPNVPLLSLFTFPALILLLAALSAYGVAFVGYAMSLKTLKVSLAYIAITASTFLLLAIYDYLFLGTSLNWQKILAILMIIGGIVIYARGN